MVSEDDPPRYWERGSTVAGCDNSNEGSPDLFTRNGAVSSKETALQYDVPGSLCKLPIASGFL
jgi:hypothetical protein